MVKFDPSRIALARTMHDLTKTELADRVGCTVQQLTEWETGKRSPTVGHLVKISNAIPCQVKVFFVPSGDDNQDSEEASAA